MEAIPGRYRPDVCVAISVLLCMMLILPSAATRNAPPQALPETQPSGSGPEYIMVTDAGILGDPGSGWSPDTFISWPYASEAQRNASIAADRDGLVRVAYESYHATQSGTGICIVNSPNGGLLWDSAFCLAIGPFESQTHPSVAMNVSGGEALIAFESSTGGLLLAQEFLHVSGCCVVLTTNPTDRNPSIAMSQDGSGIAFLAFERDDGAGGTDLMFMAARDRGTWTAWETPQTLVGEIDNSINRFPRIAWGDPFNVYVAYERQNTTGNGDIFVMRSANGGIPGSWSPQPGMSVAETEYDESAGDIAAVSGSPKVVVTYARTEGSSDHIIAAHSDDFANPGTWNYSPVTADPSDHRNPQVAAVPAVGAVRVVYWSSSGVFESIAPLSSLSTWTSPIRVTDSGATLTAEYDAPAIAAYPYGGKWYTGVVWTDYRNGPPNSDIYFTMNSPQLPSSHPDLSPTAIKLSPGPPLSNNTLAEVNVTVANLGNASTGAFDLLLFDDGDSDMNPDSGENISLSPSPGLAGYSQTDISLWWDASPAGSHSICAFADPPMGTVTESNETNNTVCIDVIIQPGPVLEPDYAPVSPLPPQPIKVGMSQQVSLSVRVHNQGNGTATDNAIVAFHEQSSPPFATFVLNPLAPATNSSRFTADWMSLATPGTYMVSADVDYENNVTEWDEMNNVYTWTIEIASGPVTSLVVGNPNYTSTATYVRSSTPLSLSVLDQGGSGIKYTKYRVDNVTWTDYYSSFFLSGEGDHYVEYYSEDNAGNVEEVSWRVLRVDDTPPATAISIGEPKYLVGGTYVNSSTPLTLSAVDGGVGYNSTFYRLWDGMWTSWQGYSTSFTLAGRDGTWYVEYLSYDYLGNVESVQNETLTLDDTSPVTTILPATGPYTTDTVFTLAATDAGCGLNATRYRIDGGNWIVYSGGFTLPEGEHNISYYSNDMLNNTEEEKWLVVTVEGQTPPPPPQPPEVAVNYKPIMALMFAIILLVAGVWSSKRRPWKGGKERTAAVKMFTFTCLPFTIAEAATGVVSFLTGELSIPPYVGVGTAVDLIILLAGLVVAVLRVLKTKPMKAEAASESEGR